MTKHLSVLKVRGNEPSPLIKDNGKHLRTIKICSGCKKFCKSIYIPHEKDSHLLFLVSLCCRQKIKKERYNFVYYEKEVNNAKI
jgi:hypothetical protein